MSNNPESKFTILFVEDDEMQAEPLKKVFELTPDCSAFFAPTVEVALQYLSDHPQVDCIVTDYHIAETTAIELVDKMLIKNPSLETVPIIILTAMPSKSVITSLPKSATVMGMLCKPYNFEVLFTLLKDVKEKNYRQHVMDVQRYLMSRSFEEDIGVAKMSYCLTLI
jgi:response regulator RpfG family c-di-GMP phosphodiesterase